MQYSLSRWRVATRVMVFVLKLWLICLLLHRPIVNDKELYQKQQKQWRRNNKSLYVTPIGWSTNVLSHDWYHLVINGLLLFFGLVNLYYLLHQQNVRFLGNCLPLRCTFYLHFLLFQQFPNRMSCSLFFVTAYCGVFRCLMSLWVFYSAILHSVSEMYSFVCPTIFLANVIFNDTRSVFLDMMSRRFR